MQPAGATILDLQPRRYDGEYGAHAHDHAQVLIGLSGHLQLEVDGRAALVDACSGLVVPAGARHAYLADAPAHVLVLDCVGDMATDRFRCFAVPARWRSRGAHLPGGTILQGLAATTTLHVRRRVDLQDLTRRIDAQLHRDWTLADLAACWHLSPQRFRARFAELAGMPPLAYVRSRRLERAIALLAQGVALEATALQVGYASASALSFALRRDLGVGKRDLRPNAPARQASLAI